MIYDSMRWCYLCYTIRKSFLITMERQVRLGHRHYGRSQVNVAKICEDMYGFGRKSLASSPQTNNKPVWFHSLMLAMKPWLHVFTWKMKNQLIIFLRKDYYLDKTRSSDAEDGPKCLDFSNEAMRFTNSVLTQLQTVSRFGMSIFLDLEIALKWINSRPLRDAGLMILNRLTDISKIVMYDNIRKPLHPRWWRLLIT